MQFECLPRHAGIPKGDGRFVAAVKEEPIASFSLLSVTNDQVARPVNEQHAIFDCSRLAPIT
jgi:hypothetical protein